MTRRLIIGLIAAVFWVTARPAVAVELCAALDGSASVVWFGPVGNEFELQLEGLASAVENPLIVPPNGSVHLSVVTFGREVRTDLPSILINSPATAAGVAAAIRALPKPTFDFGHGTDMTLAMAACLEEFRDANDEWVIDISTDGGHNLTSQDFLLSARDDALSAGLDVLNAIGVGEADLPSLGDLVWPQPVSSPPEKGFVIAVAGFPEYVDAMREKVRAEVQTVASLDIKPGSCPNSFNRTTTGVLPVAVLGSADLDVLEIDPSSILLEGVAPVRWSYEDVAAPVARSGAPESCLDCTEDGPDGHLDLTLKFDAPSIAALLGEFGRDDCTLLTLRGTLKPEYGGKAVTGEDTLRIVR